MRFKIPDGSKFCSECGAQLGGGRQSSTRQGSNTRTHGNDAERYKIIERYNNNMDAVLADYHNVDERTQNLIWKVIIEMAFSEVFNKKQQFYKYGSEIYIIGKDSITREVAENIEEYYMSSDPEEIPLLVFDYTGKGLKEGFVITNERFVFNFSEKGQQEFQLRKLKDVEIGKAILANVMYLYTVDGIKSDKIFLTSAGDETGFAMAFRKFVQMINMAYIGLYHPEKFNKMLNDDSEDKSNSGKGINSNFIASACHCVQFGFADDCEVGNPVLPETKKVAKMRKTLRIPANEDVFLIYMVTGFGKGLAICKSGVYFAGDSGRDYLDWKDFADATITVGIMSTSVSINYNEMGVGFAGKKLAMILQDLQEHIR